MGSSPIPRFLKIGNENFTEEQLREREEEHKRLKASGICGFLMPVNCKGKIYDCCKNDGFDESGFKCRYSLGLRCPPENNYYLYVFCGLRNGETSKDVLKGIGIEYYF